MPSLAPEGDLVLSEEEVQVEALFLKFSTEAAPSSYLKYLIIPEFDARDAFTTDPVFDLGDREMTDADCAGSSIVYCSFAVSCIAPWKQSVVVS